MNLSRIMRHAWRLHKRTGEAFTPARFGRSLRRSWRAERQRVAARRLRSRLVVSHTSPGVVVVTRKRTARPVVALLLALVVFVLGHVVFALAPALADPIDAPTAVRLAEMGPGACVRIDARPDAYACNPAGPADAAADSERH